MSAPAGPTNQPPAGRAAARPQRTKTPTVLQMEAVECGAAALGIILSYYGRIVPLEELRVACGVSRDGSKAGNIVKAARTYGLTAKGLRKDLASVRAVPLPFIAFWNFNHFLVVEGFEKDRVFLNDPARGPRIASLEEFDRSFTGVVLVFELGPDFVKGGAKPSVVQALGRRLRGSREAVLYVVLVSLALVVLGLITPSFTQIFIDQYLVGRLASWLRPLLVAMLLTATLLGVFTWLRQRYLLRLEAKLALTSASAFFWHVLNLPIVFFTQRSAGEISNRVALNDKVAQLLSGDLATNLLGIVLVVIYVGLMLRYDAVLTALAVVVAIGNLVALRYVARKRTDQNQRLLQQRGQLMGTAFNGLQSIESLKASGAESDFFARISGYLAKSINAEQDLGLSTQVLAAVPPLLTAINTAAILVIGGLRVIDGQLSIGVLAAFQVLMLAFMTPITQMVSLGAKMQEVAGDMTRLDDVLRYPAEQQALVELAVPGAATTKLTGYLELHNISFGYSQLEPPLIEQFNLTLKPGSRVALVGGTGSGKSTLAKLVTGLYAPWGGEVLFDGQPRSATPHARIVNSLAIVDQDIALFEGTIKDNLTLWDATVSENNIVQAAKDACIHEEISDRPGGYGFLVEENGRNFSGGQRQRLEIARALVGNPSILVLDEATSALDPITEQRIDDNLRRRGCTCLIIAHRLSTIRDCDEIIVLERGKVVQRGTHVQMQRVDGPYRRLMMADQTTKPKSYLEII